MTLCVRKKYPEYITIQLDYTKGICSEKMGCKASCGFESPSALESKVTEK